MSKKYQERVKNYQKAYGISVEEPKPNLENDKLKDKKFEKKSLKKKVNRSEEEIKIEDNTKEILDKINEIKSGEFICPNNLSLKQKREKKRKWKKKQKKKLKRLSENASEVKSELRKNSELSELKIEDNNEEKSENEDFKIEEIEQENKKEEKKNEEKFSKENNAFNLKW